jgi:hypothetical protein
MEELNTTVQKGQVLLATAKKHPKGGDANGISDSATTKLETAVADATAKDVAQQKATTNAQNMTAAQDMAMANASVLHTATLNAAKAAYAEENKQKLKRYPIGKAKINTVKDMKSSLEYLQVVATEDSVDLLANGLTQSDIDSFPAVIAGVVKADTDQAFAQKEQKKATAARNTSEKKLKAAMRRVVNQAQSAFAKQKDVRAEFVPPRKPAMKKKTDAKAKAASSAATETKK